MKKLTMFVVSIFFLTSVTLVFAQQVQKQVAKPETTKIDSGQKKALDAFITATTKSKQASEPVPGAEITVEQVPGPVIIKKCVTDKNGEFSVAVEEIELAYEKIERTKITKLASPGDEITFRMTIKPPKGWMGMFTSNQVTIKVRKISESKKAKFEFVLWWEREGKLKTNKGSFAINPKAQS